VVIALLALGAVLGFQKIRDFDYWWHLRTGQLIAETGAVPRTDVFTYSVPGNRWVDIHWLFQLGLHGVHRLGGDDAVVVARSVLVVGLVALLLPIGWRREGAFLSGLAIGLALLVASDRFEPRPELPSFLLLAALLGLVDRHERRGGYAILAAVPLQLLWANVHGLFAVGLAVLGIALVTEALRPLVLPGERLRPDRLRGLALALALSGLATLANPNGVDGLLYPIEQLRMVGPESERGVFGSLIAELLPPFGSELPMNGFLRILLAALAALSLGTIALNWRRASVFDALCWVAFGWLALGAHRNVALFALVAAPIAVRNGNAFLARRAARPRAASWAALAVAAALVLAIVDVASDRFAERAGSPRETGFGTLDFFHTVGAADWIARERPPGPIAHHMADGGYLIERLWPDYRVLSDGRLEVFGPETFARLQFFDPDSFRALDSQYRFGAVVVHYSLFDSRDLLWWLHLNPNWRLVQLDDTAALFVREGTETRRWPELALDAKDLFPPLPDEHSIGDRWRRLARVNFLVSMRRYADALPLWEETIARYPDLPQARLLQAFLLRETGFAAAAEALLREEMTARPGDPDVLAQIADLRWQSGDVAGAQDLLDRALALDPNHPYALQRRAQLAEAQGDLEGARHYGERLRALTPAAEWVTRAGGG
jgi:tetratricopeptide (TPR) repeat protein